MLPQKECLEVFSKIYFRANDNWKSANYLSKKG